MKYIDDLEEVMHITGETNYVELQKKGYDVLSYLKRKQEKILSKIEDIQSIIDECSSVASGSKKKTTNLTYMDLNLIFQIHLMMIYPFR